MNQSVVTDAVRARRSRGERVSVRAVHSVIGHGSFRDLNRLLREAKEFFRLPRI
jgi:hypothetical protein